ncbi:MAG: DUF1592 domain-containing protein [Polyangiales bacterium]
MPYRTLLLLPFAVAACTGTISDAGNPPDTPGVCQNGDCPPTVVECDDGPYAAEMPLGRLAADEYQRTLREILGDGVAAELNDALGGLPVDAAEEGESFRRLDQRTSDQHISAYYRVADAAGTLSAADEESRVDVAGECARSALDAECFAAFAQSFQTRALRRSPTDEERTRALALFDEFPGFEAIHALVFTTLMAPEFLYRFENLGVRDGNTLHLTGAELATRLAYHFWGAPPDEALITMAEAGVLDSDAGYEEVVQQLFDDERTSDSIERFFLEWLHLERGDFGRSPRLTILSEGLDTDGLGAEMREEVEALIRFHLGNEDGWDDVLRSERSFAQSERLAGIYGVESWDGVGEAPLLPAGERSGLLTRAGMLQTADGSTNPFRRGAFLRREILCDTVLPPPNDLPPDALQPPPLEEGASTRDVFASKVVNQPCSGCHAAFTPLGYVLEAFDGLGRFRDVERVVTSEGVDFGEAALDTVAVPNIDGDMTVMGSPVELSDAIAESPKSNRCFATQYFRYTFRRHEEPVDECSINDLAAELEDGASMRDALRSIALSSSFRLRALPEESRP